MFISGAVVTSVPSTKSDVGEITILSPSWSISLLTSTLISFSTPVITGITSILFSLFTLKTETLPSTSSLKHSKGNNNISLLSATKISALALIPAIKPFASPVIRTVVGITLSVEPAFSSPVGEILSTTPSTVSSCKISALMVAVCPTCIFPMSYSLTKISISIWSIFSTTNIGLSSSVSSANRPILIFTLVIVPSIGLVI